MELILHGMSMLSLVSTITSSNAVAVIEHETGILTSTKVRKTGSKKMDISIYATTNDIEELSKPFRSRFMEFSLPPYTYNEFCDIAIK